MKRIIFVTAFLALVFFLAKSPLVGQYINSGSFAFWETQGQIEREQSRLAARQLFKQLDNVPVILDEVEQQYLENVTQSLNDLSLFQDRYCFNDDKNAVVFGEKLEQICSLVPSILTPMTAGNNKTSKSKNLSEFFYAG